MAAFRLTNCSRIPDWAFAAHWDFCGFDNDLWTVTNATSGTLAAISGHGGVVRVSAGAATDAQGVRSAQPGGAASQFITPAAGRIIVVEALLKDTPQTSTLNSRWFGLATQTTGLRNGWRSRRHRPHRLHC